MILNQNAMFARKCVAIGVLLGITSVLLLASYGNSLQPPKPLGQVWPISKTVFYAFAPDGSVMVNDTSGHNYFRFDAPKETTAVRALWNSQISPGFQYERYSFPDGEAILTASFYPDHREFSLTVYGEIPPSMYDIMKIANLTLPASSGSI